MKRSFFSIIVLCLICSNFAGAQGTLLKKVAGAMKDELLGTGGGSSKQEDEPGCACDQPETVLDMGGKLKLDYRELNITSMDDGSLLAQDQRSGAWYIISGGVTQGPIPEGDPRLTGYLEDNAIEGLMTRYRGIITQAGDKYQITLGGKTWGPYAEIHDFKMSPSKEKFACFVIENIAVTEDEGEKMEAAMKNAKSDQERLELAMKFSQQMTNKMMEGGGPESQMPKLVTNIEGAVFNPLQESGFLSAKSKYDDILAITYNSINTLQGKTLFRLTNEMMSSSQIFVNSSDSKYAYFDYGTLAFSDGKSLTDCFNPHLLKTGGQVYLVYMYYSPKRNAIVQCKIPW